MRKSAWKLLPISITNVLEKDEWDEWDEEDEEIDYAKRENKFRAITSILMEYSKHRVLEAKDSQALLQRSKEIKIFERVKISYYVISLLLGPCRVRVI